MNPIFNGRQKQSKLMKANPRESVLNAIGNMSTYQKEKLKRAFPVAQSIAKRQGIDISNVINEIQSRL